MVYKTILLSPIISGKFDLNSSNKIDNISGYDLCKSKNLADVDRKYAK